jgi:hypothetical protein
MLNIKAINFFITSLGNEFMIEIARVFSEAFEYNKIKTTIFIDEVPAKCPDDILQIVVAPHEFYPIFLEKICLEKEIIEITKACYFLNVEQPGTAGFECIYHRVKYAKGIFDINQQSVIEFSKRGITASHLPLGYSMCLNLEL